MVDSPAVILARADPELRALMHELGDAAAAERLGLDLDGLIEAAQARAERLFWVSAIPTSTPGRRRTGRSQAPGFTVRCALPSPTAGKHHCRRDASQRAI